MNILMPMAGAGKRFADAGYKDLKPLILTTERRDGEKYPMVICAMRDIPECDQEDTRQYFVIRTDYREAISPKLLQYYPNAKIIGVDHLTEGQACTCLLAKEYIDNDSELFIAGCDNGMVFDETRFFEAKKNAEVLVFTYRHNDAVMKNPSAYGWVKTEEHCNKVIDVSVKKAISNNPMEDHAIVASFWFRRGLDFVKYAEEMIAENDRINGEFYVDQVMHYCVKAGLDVNVFEVDRYLGWGTPKEYEDYEQTIQYWREFTKSSAFSF